MRPSARRRPHSKHRIRLRFDGVGVSGNRAARLMLTAQDVLRYLRSKGADVNSINKKAVTRCAPEHRLPHECVIRECHGIRLKRGLCLVHLSRLRNKASLSTGEVA